MNRLLKEKSPYLQQHKNNPVDWYPWGDEAFEKARKENKPIFLSIGYSSCHWCHVMEHESFEDPEVAKILNDGFVSIKVDREERPDIDSIYMLVCQMMTGHGGWPLSIFMNASKQAFFAGTYFPKSTSQGRLGFTDVLKRIQYVWSNQKKDLHATIQNIQQALQESQKHQSGSTPITEIIESCVSDLKNMFDPIRGGFGTKPKFPSPQKLLLLMAHYRWSRDKDVLIIIEKTLQEMHRGGIYDHIRGGFHRYSTDENWELPHFEKMLYDQALCARMYLEAYQITHNELYKAVAEKTIQYVCEDLMDSDGHFMSAYDADSEGEEGAFYTWPYSELKIILNEDEFKKIEKYFDIRQEGNFLDEATHEPVAKNILFLKKAVASFESGYFALESIFEKLRDRANKRVKPLCDHKVLADWNCLFLQTLWVAYDITGNAFYKETAINSLQALEKTLIHKEHVYHRLCEEEVLKKEFLDDISGAIAVYISAYRSTQQELYLEKANDLAGVAIQKFYDSASGGFYLTSANQNEFGIRTKDFYDGAYPSANSYMIENMVHLWNITGQSKYKKIIETFLQSSTATFSQSPTAFCYALRAFVLWNQGPLEIQVQGNWDEKSKTEIKSILRSYYLPEKYLKITESENRQIQICRGMSCSLPLLEISTFKKELTLLYNS